MGGAELMNLENGKEQQPTCSLLWGRGHHESAAGAKSACVSENILVWKNLEGFGERPSKANPRRFPFIYFLENPGNFRTFPLRKYPKIEQQDEGAGGIQEIWRSGY